MNLLSALDDAPAEERSEKATAGEPKHQDKCTGGNSRYTLMTKEGSKVVCLELINRKNNTVVLVEYSLKREAFWFL